MDPNNAWTAALQGLGLLDAQPADELVYLWPDNVRTWQLWCELQTQWRTGMAGLTGLDYAGVRAFLDEEGITGDERRDAWAGIRACEREVLELQAEQQEKQQQQPSAA